MSHGRGVTLIELMIALVILAILAAIAYPGYRQYVIRANRANAKTALLQTAQALERCYTRSAPYAYDSAACNTAVTLPFTPADGTYEISGDRNANAYTLTATPKGAQADDSECGSFTLDQDGRQSVTGSWASTPERCWSR